MDIASALSTVSAASQTSTPSSQAKVSEANDEMGKDEFLRLLVTQLSNQDPLSPMEGQEFAAQLAQFTSVEQLTNIRKEIAGQQDANGLLTQSVNSGVAAGMLGKTVEAEGNAVVWTGEGEATLGITLAAPAAEAVLEVRDAAGNVMHTRTLQNVEAGPQTFTWGGTTDQGANVPEGTYTFGMSAANANGQPIEAGTYLSGQVQRVTFGAEGVQLWVDGTQVSMSRVRSVENL